MWNNKNKAITFSFDDGVTQDVRLVEMFNKYNLKCTFNINSANLGLKNALECNGVVVSHYKNQVSEIRNIYSGHEVAGHTLTHPDLTQLSDDTVVYQVEQDRKVLSDVCGYDVVGMAYPGGCVDERVAKIIRERTGIKYCRTVENASNFDMQENLFQFKPTVYYIEDNLFETARKFLELKTDKPQMLYVWGHSYEMDAKCITWEKFEEFCKMVSNRSDIFYGTNKQVLLDK